MADFRCTCESFLDNFEKFEMPTCEHLKENYSSLARHKNMMFRRLRGELTSGSPVQVLSNTLSQKVGVPLELTEFISLWDGLQAVQWDAGLAVRYSEGCGWGHCGQSAFLAEGDPETSLLYLLSKEIEFSPWDQNEITATLPTLPPFPPNVFEQRKYAEPETNSCPPSPYSGLGEGVLNLETTEKALLAIEDGCQWARFWCAAFGFRLFGEGWSTVGRYLPDSPVYGAPIGAIALDLASQSFSALPIKNLEKYFFNIPLEFKNRIAHTHLSWGPENEKTSAAQVLVKHPSLKKLDKEENIQVFTTNYWLQDMGEPEWSYVRDLLAHTAEVFLRMGHNPKAKLFYGEWSDSISSLADEAPEGRPCSLDVFPLAWDTLKEKVMPVLENNLQLPKDLYTLELGRDWLLLLPPKG